MEQGYIKLFRKFTNWEWYKDQNTKDLFLHLLITANHKDTKWQGIEIKRGQVLTGRFKLAEETGLTEQQIRTSLTKLKNTQNLTIKSTSKYSIITIVKYSDYQAQEELVTNKPTNEQPTSNQQVTTNKNDKNVKNDKKYIYGTYKNVLLTEKEFNSLKKDYPNYEAIITYLDEYIEMKGYKAKSHYLCIKKWVVDAVNKKPVGKKEQDKPIWYDKKIEEQEDLEKQKELEEMIGKI